MTADQPDAALESLLGSTAGTLMERMGIEVTEATQERVVATMPVEGNTQPYGLLHGGASVVLAETIGSIGAALNAGPGRIAVGLDINATHHRAARSGARHRDGDAAQRRAHPRQLRRRRDGRGRQAGLHLADHLPAARQRARRLSA